MGNYLGRRLGVLLGFGALLLLMGCSTELTVPDEAVRTPLPTPTTHPLFATSEVGNSEGGVTAVPTSAPFVAVTTLPSRVPSSGETTVPLYSDILDRNWVLLDDPGMEVDLASMAYVHSGRTAVAMTPTADFSALFFAVRPDTSVDYRREDVLGFKFWLNGGDALIELEDLAVTIVGSNAYSHWVEGDNSVGEATSDAPLFSETRLYFLNLNRSIPANTWVEVEVWLDDLQFDPDYRYVTGFYIKNNAGFYRTVYVDDISLITVSN